MYGISCASFALTDLVIGHIDELPRMIRQGDLDVLLIRPLGSLFQIIASTSPCDGSAKPSREPVVLTVALAYVEVDWTFGRAMIAVALVTGWLIFAGVWIAFASIAFWLIDSAEVANSFTYGGNFLSQYPVNIFGSWLRRFVVFIVPMAFVAYFPCLYVFDKDDQLGLPRAFQFASPSVAVAACIAGGRVANRRPPLPEHGELTWR